MQMQIKQANTFYVFGIQHQNADLAIREMFSLSEEKIIDFYSQKQIISEDGLLILSTCNRTEIWAYSNNLEKIKSAFLQFSDGNRELFDDYSFELEGEKAIQHIFKVAAGVDSQILGDLQIQSQIKKTTRIAEEHKMLSPELNRLIQLSLKYSKRIKNETSISEGAASVAYAAVQYILENSPNIKNQKVLLFGAGKMGSLTCENLRKNIDENSLVLINRTKEKAEKLAIKIGAEVKEIENLREEIETCDVLVVATGSVNYTVNSEIYNSIGSKKRILIDLSVPRNIDPIISEKANVQIADVDFLSKLQKEAIEKRKSAIPKALEIISEGMIEFESWMSIRHLSPTFKAIKTRLHEIRKTELDFHKNKFNSDDLTKLENLTGRLMDKLARQMINHLKENHDSDSDPVKTLTSILEIKN